MKRSQEAAAADAPFIIVDRDRPNDEMPPPASVSGSRGPAIDAKAATTSESDASSPENPKAEDERNAEGGADATDGDGKTSVKNGDFNVRTKYLTAKRFDTTAGVEEEAEGSRNYSGADEEVDGHGSPGVAVGATASESKRSGSSTEHSNGLASLREVEDSCVRLEEALELRDSQYHSHANDLEGARRRIEERCRILEGRKRANAESHGNPNASDEDIIEINAGGKNVTAKRSTLRQLEGTRLDALFSGRWDGKLQRDENGRIFLDVNPKGFRAIVAFLNDVKLSADGDGSPLPDPPSAGEEHRDELERQLKLFGIEDALHTTAPGMPDSNILAEEDKARLLNDWLEEDLSEGELKLLYRSSRDGNGGKDFHSRCDGMGCTVTLVRTEEGAIFGGYSNASWGRDDWGIRVTPGASGFSFGAVPAADDVPAGGSSAPSSASPSAFGSAPGKTDKSSKLGAPAPADRAHAPPSSSPSAFGTAPDNARRRRIIRARSPAGSAPAPSVSPSAFGDVTAKAQTISGFSYKAQTGVGATVESNVPTSPATGGFSFGRSSSTGSQPAPAPSFTFGGSSPAPAPFGSATAYAPTGSLFGSSADKTKPSKSKEKETGSIGHFANPPLVGAIKALANVNAAKNGKYRSADKAFLFHIASKDTSTSCKMRVNPARTQYAVHNSDENGPTFGRCAPGAGHDFCVTGSVLELSLDGGTFDLPSIGFKMRKSNAIKEIEVFQVARSGKPPSRLCANKKVKDGARRKSKEPITVSETDLFSKGINDALNAKLRALRDAEIEVSRLEDKYEDEERFVDMLGGETKDVVTLNVSGTAMATKRSTLRVFESSLLAKQFGDCERECQTGGIEDWGPTDVAAWAGADGMPDGVRRTLEENEITGRELLALGAEGLKALGISRIGTVYLLLDEMDKLRRRSGGREAALLEHSLYCFGKILDHLRTKRRHDQNFADNPARPTIRESEKKRFENTVNHFFAGDDAKSFLGRSSPIEAENTVNR